MNTLVLTFVAFCAVLLLSVRTTDAMECYLCVGCNDPFDANGSGISKQQCTGSCSKVKAGDLVTRACIPLVKKDDCESGGDVETCLCTTDKCNGSSALSMSIVITGVIAAIGSLYRFIM